MSIRAIVRELGLHEGPLRYKDSVEGLRVDRDNTLWIGSCSGPIRSDVAALCHELGHFVETPEDRLGFYGWGLQVPEVWVFGHRCVEPVTMQITARELRVVAYQAHLHEHFKIRTSIKPTVQALKYMADSLHVPLEDGTKRYGERSKKLSSREADESQYRWCLAEVERLKKVHTLEHFFSEFPRRIQLLNERRETRVGRS